MYLNCIQMFKILIYDINIWNEEILIYKNN